MKSGARVLLGIGGGIAAFKALDTARLLMTRGADVRVVMSAAAQRFITPFSLENLTNHAVFSDLWAESPDGETHIRLANWADVFVIAPATMELIGKLALGLPDDALSCTAAACPAPLVLGPAMNTVMYQQPATQENLARLHARGATIVGPVDGRLASGGEGMGRMAEPEDIAAAVSVVLGRTGDLAGQRVLVTAGPTHEPIDPVRFVGNRSSGKMGYALATAARDRGANVVLISGPVALKPPYGVTLVPVDTADEMRLAVQSHLDDADALIMAAAVADYRPAAIADDKIKKGADVLALHLTRTTDILASLTERPVIRVGFAAETRDLLGEAARKLEHKKVDLLVANDVSGGAVFGADQTHAHVLFPGGARRELGPASKREVADGILDALVEVVHARTDPGRSGGAT